MLVAVIGVNFGGAMIKRLQKASSSSEGDQKVPMLLGSLDGGEPPIIVFEHVGCEKNPYCSVLWKGDEM